MGVGAGMFVDWNLDELHVTPPFGITDCPVGWVSTDRGDVHVHVPSGALRPPHALTSDPLPGAAGGDHSWRTLLRFPEESAPAAWRSI